MHQSILTLCVIALIVDGSNLERINHKVFDPRICAGQVHGAKLANEEDCGSFYVCDQGVAELFYCESILEFDPVLHVCNWPHLVNCQTNKVQPLEENADVEVTAQTTHGSILLPSTKELPEPAIETTDFPMSPSTQPTTTATPATTPKYQKTPPTPPRKVNSSRNTTISETSDLLEIAPTTITSRPTDPMAGYDPTNVHCLHDGLYFLPYPTKCSLYFICENRNLHLHHCADGIFWDYKTEQCNLPEKSQCYYDEIMAATTTTTTKKPITVSIENLTPKCRPGTQEFFPHPSDCQKYYICAQGNLILSNCPQNLHWNSRQMYCTVPVKADCMTKA